MRVAIPLCLILSACTQFVSNDSKKDKGKGRGDDDDTEETTEPEEFDLVGDLEITKVAIYQGVEAVLYEDGDAPNTLEMPVIVDRDALVRVHVKPDDDFDVRRVSGLLTVVSNDGEETFDERLRVEESSKMNDLETTLNYYIPGDLLKQTTEFELEIREVSADAPGGGDEDDVTWKSEDFGGLETEATDELQIVLLPIRYNFDGSGRLPDTSQSQVDRIADLVMGMYPASSVTVRVEDPVNWPYEIAANGGGWSNLLYALNDLRDSANEPPNTYYYAIFNPEANFYQFCAQGCVLGLSLLGFSASDPYFRASIGVGYTGDITSETLVHEVGHAHGREHAPCGLYGQPSDPDYPYSGAELGTWGYDIVEDRLFDPNDTVDMMSYCSPIWVSDYTFYSLYQRMQTVSNQARSVRMSRSSLSVDPDGTQTLQAPREMADTSGAPRVDVTLYNERGEAVSVTTAAWFPYDHLPGGIAIFDEILPEGWTASMQ